MACLETRVASRSNVIGWSAWWSTSTSITMSKLSFPYGMDLPSNVSTRIAESLRCRTSIPQIEISDRLSAIKRANWPSPHPTSSTLELDGISLEHQLLRTDVRLLWTYRP